MLAEQQLVIVESLMRDASDIRLVAEYNESYEQHACLFLRCFDNAEDVTVDLESIALEQA